jgi:hypothetical protein
MQLCNGGGSLENGQEYSRNLPGTAHKFVNIAANAALIQRHFGEVCFLFCFGAGGESSVCACVRALSVTGLQKGSNSARFNSRSGGFH